jgi:hypothetical protein
MGKARAGKATEIGRTLLMTTSECRPYGERAGGRGLSANGLTMTATEAVESPSNLA